MRDLRRWVLVGMAACVCLGAGNAKPLSDTVKPERVPVTVSVDFGPANRAGREERLLVDQGSTPKDVVSLLFPIQSGEVCCNTREIVSIDGVRPDPARNWWWKCRVNGSFHVSSYRTELKANDRVEWIYYEESQ